MAKHLTYKVRLNPSNLDQLRSAELIRFDNQFLWTLKPPSKWPKWAREIWALRGSNEVLRCQ